MVYLIVLSWQRCFVGQVILSVKAKDYVLDSIYLTKLDLLLIKDIQSFDS